ncbi:hypothetical protein GCM10023319_73350 [Nocardia iowensis]
MIAAPTSALTLAAQAGTGQTPAAAAAPAGFPRTPRAESAGSPQGWPTEPLRMLADRAPLTVAPPLIGPTGAKGAGVAVEPAHGGATAGDIAVATSSQALRTLQALAAMYGSGAAKQLAAQRLWEQSSANGASGATADAIAAAGLSYSDSAVTFNDLDGQLRGQLDALSERNQVDQLTFDQILRNVEVALARLGPAADTPQGRQQVNGILIVALRQAQLVVATGQANAAATAAAVDRLTRRFAQSVPAPGSPVARPGGRMPGGQVGQWIQQALGVLQRMGYDINRIDPEAIGIIIKHESSGNPNAVNNWDSNAKKGTPSKGLMQTIGPTFERWAAPGHRNIFNPVDNIVAGVRYAINRYGSVSNVPGVRAVRSGRKYVWY